MLEKKGVKFVVQEELSGQLDAEEVGEVLVKRAVAPSVSLQAVDELLVTGTELHLAVGPEFTGDQALSDSVSVRLCQDVVAFPLQLRIADVMPPTAPVNSIHRGPFAPPATVTAVEAKALQGRLPSHILNH